MNAIASRKPDEIVEYVVTHHHAFVRRALPAIARHTLEVTQSHGDRHPELYDVADLLRRLTHDVMLHMEKEEQVLFPWIVEAVRNPGVRPAAVFDSVVTPILMMERDHEAAGECVALIRELTDGYDPPPDANAMYRLWLEELKAFDEDLRAHVHLENNILFPAAARLESGTLERG
jgi:regulator of cell morphogenesis and NO signaling